MNEMLKLIENRRSIKKYKPDMVERELIDQVIQAGLNAASGMNRQSPIVVAVTDRALRDRLARANASVMGMNIDPFYGAPAVLVVLADKSCPTRVYDGSLTMGNMLQPPNRWAWAAVGFIAPRRCLKCPNGRNGSNPSAWKANTRA